jgi:hypothetical protein
VRFTLRASKDSVATREEVELTITAEYLDVSPNLIFQFEGSNTFAIKMLLPAGFVQTGGSYYDFISGEVNKEKPFQTYTIKGYFETEINEPCFTLLRSHKNAGSGDSFVKRTEKCISIKRLNSKSGLRFKDIYESNSPTDRFEVLGFTITNTSYVVNCSDIEFSGLLTNTNTTSYRVRHIIYHACGQCLATGLSETGNFFQNIDILLAKDGTKNFKLIIPISYFISPSCLDGGQRHFDLDIENYDGCASIKQNISITPQIASIASTFSEVCTNKSFTLSATGCTTYKWEGYSETSNSLTTSISASKTFRVKCSNDISTCWQQGSKTINLKTSGCCPTNIEVPTISASTTLLYDQPQAVKPTISGACDTGYTTKWYKDGLEYTGSLSNINSLGTYIMKCVQGDCSVSSNSITIESKLCNVTAPTAPFYSYQLNSSETIKNVQITSTYPDSEIFWDLNGSQWKIGGIPVTGKNQNCGIGEYQVYIQLANGCNTAANKTKFTIQNCPAPAAPTLTTSTTILPYGTTATIFASGCSYADLKWETAGGSQISGDVGTLNGYTSQIGNRGAGTYKARCVVAGCSSNYASITLTEKACDDLVAPNNVGSEAVNNNILPGNFTRLLARGCAVQMANYEWTSANGSILPQQGATFPHESLVDNVGPGTFYVRCVKGNCRGPQSSIIITQICPTVPSIIQVNAENNIPRVNPGGGKAIYASGCGNLEQTKWSIDGGPLINSNGGGGALGSITDAGVGKYRAKCVINGCEGPFSAEFEIKNFSCDDFTIYANTIPANNTTTYLEGSELKLFASVSNIVGLAVNNGFSVFWERQNAIFTDLTDGDEYTITQLKTTDAGTYRRRLYNITASALVCYSNPITIAVTPKLDCDNIYIKSTNAALAETTKFTRANGQYERLTIAPATFDGSGLSTQFSYSWIGPGDAVAVADKNKAQIDVKKVGEYIVNISNGFQQCSQKIALSGTACSPASNAPNFCNYEIFTPNLLGATLPNLVVGDIITAGSFEYTITQVDNPTQPFKGRATMNIINGPGNLKAGLKTEFAGISINECYQVTAVPAQPFGYFRSEYDPSWGNIVDLRTNTPKPAEAGEEISGLIALNEKIETEMEALTTSCAQRERLVQYLAEINAIMAQIQASTDYTAAEKADLLLNQNNITIPLNSLVGVGGCLVCIPTGGRVAAPENVNCAPIDKDVFTNTNDYYNEKVEEKYFLTPKKIMIFANGYRDLTSNFLKIFDGAPFLEPDQTNNSVTHGDGNNYWANNKIFDRVDYSFKQRRKPDEWYYIDGHHSLETSSHKIFNDVNKDIIEFARIMGVSNNARDKKYIPNPEFPQVSIMNPSWHNADNSVTLHTTPNNTGFGIRFENGVIASKNFYKELQKKIPSMHDVLRGAKILKIDISNFKFEIDVVAHSMGFAYAQGFIYGLKEILPANRLKWSGYYIIAPENPAGYYLTKTNTNGGLVYKSDWTQIYQYGSNLGQGSSDEDPKWLQDGVAPQKGVVGLSLSDRVFIPNEYGVTPNKKPMPKGFLESHSISNYGWIFDGTLKTGEPGYVTSK